MMVSVAAFDFLFVPGQSPIVGSWRALRQGHVDAWLFELARGSEDLAGEPLAAVVLLALWALAFAGVLRGLRRSLRGA